jgi:hypothetical protein
MSAFATRVLDAVVTAVEAEYPDARVRRRRNTPAVPMVSPADSLPMFSASIGDPEEIEVLTGGPDPQVAVKYPVWVAYLVAQAGIANTSDDTPDVRDKRQAIRQRLHLLEPADFPEWNDVFAGAKSAFQPGDLGKAVIASVMTFTVEIIESRN